MSLDTFDFSRSVFHGDGAPALDGPAPWQTEPARTEWTAADAVELADYAAGLPPDLYEALIHQPGWPAPAGNLPLDAWGMPILSL